MAGLIVPMFLGLKAAIAGAATAGGWPDAALPQIYRSETLDTIPWSQLPVPYNVIVASDFQKTEIGAAQIAFFGSVQFLRMGKWGQPGQDDALLTQLDDLLFYLINHGIGTAAQVWSYDGMDWGDEIPGNAIVTSKDYNNRIARLSCTVLIGYA